ncbi:MAG: hypothetical protein ABI625_24420 [bacterium]
MTDIPTTPFGRMAARSRRLVSHQIVEDGCDDVDRASEDSFPASDPPPWNGVRLGSPRGAGEIRGSPVDNRDDDIAFGEGPPSA